MNNPVTCSGYNCVGKSAAQFGGGGAAFGHVPHSMPQRSHGSQHQQACLTNDAVESWYAFRSVHTIYFYLSRTACSPSCYRNLP